MTGCRSSRHVHDCAGEEVCGLAGLPHLICVPIPPYAAQRRAETPAEQGENLRESLADRRSA